MFPEPYARSRGHCGPAVRLRLAALLMSLAAATLLVLVGACGGDSSTESELTGSPTGSAAASSPTPEGATPSPTTARTPLPTLGPTFLPGCGAVGLTSELNLGAGQFAQGEPILIAMTLKNCGDNVVHLYYPNGERYDFFAQDESGVEVWRWSDGKTFEQSLGELQMAVGETAVYTESWDQRDSKGKQVPPGRYKIFAFSVGCVEPTASNCTFGPVGLVDIKP